MPCNGFCFVYSMLATTPSGSKRTAVTKTSFPSTVIVCPSVMSVAPISSEMHRTTDVVSPVCPSFDQSDVLRVVSAIPLAVLPLATTVSAESVTLDRIHAWAPDTMSAIVVMLSRKGRAGKTARPNRSATQQVSRPSSSIRSC